MMHIAQCNLVETSKSAAGAVASAATFALHEHCAIRELSGFYSSRLLSDSTALPEFCSDIMNSESCVSSAVKIRS